ncbi:MAG: RNA polymerase subunit alpha domain protein, partial [Planctomycetia bacterium]
MTSTATLDVRDLVTGTGAFGPADIRNLLEALGSDPAAHRDLRGAVQELEAAGERSPAASVRLGVCQHLLGRSRDALE